MLAKALPNSLPCTHQPSIKRLSTRVSAASSTSERSNHCRPLSVSHTATYERILRYPDGKERRIIYPLADPADPCEETCDTCFDETWESDHPWDVPGIPKDSSEAPPKAVTAPDQTQRKVSQLPSSPMELLRYLQSADYKAAQEANWQAVRDSYEVLHGCPWVLPRPVYVLAAARNRVADAGATYTLRTRVERKEAEGELTRVCYLQQRQQPVTDALYISKPLTHPAGAQANARRWQRAHSRGAGDGWGRDV